ncbi:MAG: TlpA family protein disulfide reductase [Gammaproteobacteria bacterium]|nr:TlpA family protein disulfide reductase [Gammaproteobacteria bacterium]
MTKLTYPIITILLLISANIAGSQTNLPKGLLALKPLPAPTTRLQDIDGKTYDLTEDRGSVVFVHFWASWCGPCRREMPAIQKMWNIMQKEGLKIALINTAEDEDTVFSFLASYAPDIRALMDKDGQVTEKWQPRGLPASYIINKNGYIIYQALGGRPWDDKTYLNFIRQILKED